MIERGIAEQNVATQMLLHSKYVEKLPITPPHELKLHYNGAFGLKNHFAVLVAYQAALALKHLTECWN